LAVDNRATGNDATRCASSWAAVRGTGQLPVSAVTNAEPAHISRDSGDFSKTKHCNLYTPPRVTKHC